ncbi:hypothetical protein UPYG_G00107110 [Umbra pygmaea]|uniref:Uncharacterized protein n=1 Tax=Umbra pygmaea TaxID=75934 RepID=A0ABD0XHR2_UMBPY
MSVTDPGWKTLALHTKSILEKNNKQSEELVRLRTQLALQTGPDLQQFDSQLRQDTGIQDNLVCGLSVKAGSGKKTSFRDLFLRTILQRAIRKNAAIWDSTDKAVQNQVTRYLKGAADHAGGRRRCGGTSDQP